MLINQDNTFLDKALNNFQESKFKSTLSSIENLCPDAYKTILSS